MSFGSKEKDILNPQVFCIPHLGEQVENDTFCIPLLICFNESKNLYNQKYYDISVHKYVTLPFQAEGDDIVKTSINKIYNLGLQGMEADQPFYPYITRFEIGKSKNIRVNESQIMFMLSNGDIHVNRIENEFYNSPLRAQRIRCGKFNPANAIDIYKYKRVVACENGEILLFDSSSGLNELDPISIGQFSILEDGLSYQNFPLILDLNISPYSSDIVFGATSRSQMIMWDSRQAFFNIYNGLHNGPANVISSHPSNEFLLVTGGLDNSVKIWDLRKLNNSHMGHARPLNSFTEHSAKINKVAWNPREIDTLASCSDDGKVNIYKINRYSAENNLFFAHYGHRGPVSWLDWFALNEGVLSIASVSSSYGDSRPCLQVWEPDMSSFKSLSSLM